MVPNHGLANLCLAQMALARGRKADSAEAMRYLETAVKGDPLSLNAWTLVAAGHEASGDTTTTVSALKQMLVIAPTMLGATVVENLFGDANPVGEIIRVKGIPFRVIGVLDRVAENSLQRFRLLVADGREFVLRHDPHSGDWQLAQVLARRRRYPE